MEIRDWRLLGVLAVLAMCGIVNADCDGTVSIIGGDVLQEGSSYTLGVYYNSDVPAQQTLELQVKDADGNNVITEYKTYTDEIAVFNFDATEMTRLPKGSYVISARIRTYNLTDLTQMYCENQQSKTVVVDSTRRRYNGIVVLSVTPEYKRGTTTNRTSVCQNVTLRQNSTNYTISYPVCVNISGLEENATVTIAADTVLQEGAFSLSDLNVSMTLGGPEYNYAFVSSLYAANVRLAELVETMRPRLEAYNSGQDNVTYNLMQLAQFTNTTYEILAYEQFTNRNLSMTLAENTRTKITDISFDNPLFTFILGVIAVFVVLYIIGVRKKNNRVSR